MLKETVRSFEDLRVFQEARELVNQIHTVTRAGAFARDRGLVDQMRRAGVSVLSNIAEGFERGTDADFARYLFIAKGSCGEVRAQLLVAFDQKYLPKETFEDLSMRCRRIGGSLSKLITYLKGSSATSPRRP